MALDEAFAVSTRCDGTCCRSRCVKNWLCARSCSHTTPTVLTITQQPTLVPATAYSAAVDHQLNTPHQTSVYSLVNQHQWMMLQAIPCLRTCQWQVPQAHHPATHWLLFAH